MGCIVISGSSCWDSRGGLAESVERSVVRSCLDPGASTSSTGVSASTMSLFVTPPRRVLKDDDTTTLAAADLAPAALVHCSLDGRACLRAEVRALGWGQG